MPAASTETLLSQALSKVKHRNPDLVKRDILTSLHHYRGLIPKPDKFIFNDGVTRDMINIYGTIPVPYKGQNYNIPVSLWILDSHPYHAPICYVKPTAEMQIKVSKHVDQSGKIYLPYLHEWSHPKSELLGLIQILIVTFSEQPPVYSRPKNPEAPGAAQQQQQPSVLQYPVYPPNLYPSSNTGFSYQGYNPTNAYAFPTPTTLYQPQPQQQQNNFYVNNSGENPENLKQQLLTKVEEQVKAKLREEVMSKQTTTEELRQIGDKLNDGGMRLNTILSKLKLEISELDQAVEVSDNKIDEMTRTKSRIEEAGDEVDPDEAVTATAPVFKQLMNAHAEDAAIEDALYFLGESLRRGILDCEQFLRHVRNLSRKQFLLRATMLKCRQNGGLQS